MHNQRHSTVNLKKGTKIANKTSTLNTHNPKISGKYCDALANKQLYTQAEALEEIDEWIGK